KTRMKITAYNQHDVGSSHEPWSSSSHTNLLATSQRRYAIKRSETMREAHRLAQSKDPAPASATTILARIPTAPVLPLPTPCSRIITPSDLISSY
ncbi:MAG: hypothetical protein WBF04_13130, partial [Candidatus Sulfotelmatobacter sp.]